MAQVSGTVQASASSVPVLTGIFICFAVCCLNWRTADRAGFGYPFCIDFNDQNAVFPCFIGQITPDSGA